MLKSSGPAFSLQSSGGRSAVDRATYLSLAAGHSGEPSRRDFRHQGPENLSVRIACELHLMMSAAYEVICRFVVEREYFGEQAFGGSSLDGTCAAKVIDEFPREWRFGHGSVMSVERLRRASLLPASGQIFGE